MCTIPSGWSLAIALHLSLILGTDDWQTGPWNELPPLWHPSPAFSSSPGIQVAPDLRLILPLLLFLVDKESLQSLQNNPWIFLGLLNCF